MKIALLGYGKMGQKVEQIAMACGHEIVARIRSDRIGEENVKHADLCIEFSHPEVAFKNLVFAASHKKDIVVGTTGWYDKIEFAKSLVHQHNIGLLYAPNFSIGVYLFMKLLENAGNLMKDFIEYDIGIIEYHHKQKKDAPSGTAKQIASILENNMQGRSLSISNVRCGSIPGKHTVIFDSICDNITLTHEARNRDGMAIGALRGAEWLLGKKGVYTLKDWLDNDSKE